MRVNVYAEEMTDRIEIVEKIINGVKFTGLRLYLELPVTMNPSGVQNGNEIPQNYVGPFLHSKGDDDSAAITFWGKRDLREVVDLMIEKLDDYYNERDAFSDNPVVGENDV